jgi:D-alanine-D-alanine ligase
MTWDDKYHRRMDEPRKICPAALDSSLGRQLNELALNTFRTCRLRDYARVDIRIDSAGRPFVLEINSMASLGDGGSYVTAAKAAGHDVRSLIGRILDVAYQRSFHSSPANEIPAKTPEPAETTDNPRLALGV